MKRKITREIVRMKRRKKSNDDIISIDKNRIDLINSVKLNTLARTYILPAITSFFIIYGGCRTVYSLFRRKAMPVQMKARTKIKNEKLILIKSI